MRIIIIDPIKREVTQKIISEFFPAVKDVIGDWVESVFEMENGDRLYCDENGLEKTPQHFFRIVGVNQPIAGIGVLTGRETETGVTLGVQSSIYQIKNKVEFMARADFDRWVIAHQDKTLMEVRTFDGHNEVVVYRKTFGDLLKDAKKN